MEEEYFGTLTSLDLDGIFKVLKKPKLLQIKKRRDLESFEKS